MPRLGMEYGKPMVNAANLVYWQQRFEGNPSKENADHLVQACQDMVHYTIHQPHEDVDTSDRIEAELEQAVSALI